MNNTFLSNLEWRFSTKKFDATKKVSEEDKGKILNALRLAPTSFGLQPFKVFVIENPETREKIKIAAHGQPQVTDASFLLVFAAKADVVKRAEEYVELASGGNAELKEKMAGIVSSMKALEGTPDKAVAWSAKQSYIALGFALATCAELGIDSCPMEGFNPAEVDKILNLPENLKSQAFLAVGYRAEGPAHPKFRFPESDIFEKI